MWLQWGLEKFIICAKEKTMRIKNVSIKNFRCLDDVNIEFDQITTFIGPNGAGKSSVLRALEWFFNGDRAVVMTAQDIFSGADEDKRIIVEVTFHSLTRGDRDLLGEKYAPQGVDEVSIRRIWNDGSDKLTGKAMAYLPFEAVRACNTATARKAAYQEVVREHSDLSFSPWTNDGAAEAMMTAWEREHQELLEEADISATNLFGFAGQGRLSGRFDYVLITADMRAAEESQDSKATVLGRILEKAVDRAAADAELEALSVDLAKRHREITDRYYSDQLEALSADLTSEVSNFATGRDVTIESIQVEFKPQTTKFQVKIDDHGTQTVVERQGHGFQRSLLLAALKLLAQRGAAEGDDSVVLLAIEEPELFQHPAQAKAFASVLRKLAEDSSSGIQVAYATHSPYFVEPSYFDQVRRVERDVSAAAGSQVVIHHASMDKVATALTGYVDDEAVRSRLDNSCLNELRDALFGSAALVLEGSTDDAIIQGAALQSSPLSTGGIEVAVAGSKDQLYLPVAILKQLGIPHFVLFDSDIGSEHRMRANGKDEPAIAAQKRADAAKNKKLLRFLSLPEQDWPKGVLSPVVAVIDDTLETMVTENWPEFERERASLVAAGRGADGKNAATYRLAAKSAENIPGELMTVIEAVRALSA
jgi:putative ATP-dependent endonuclease of OLD family